MTMRPVTAATLLRGLLRRWPLILGVPLAVALLTWLLPPRSAPVLQAQLTVAIDVPPEVLVPGSDEGTAAKIGEALIDDLSRILPGDAFAEAVAARLPEGVHIAPGESSGSLSADDRHRVMDISITRSAAVGADPADVDRLRAELRLIARAVVRELETDGGRWLALLGADGVRLTVVDGPSVGTLPRSLRQRLDAPLRIAVATLLALGLAATLHLFDPHVRETTDAVSSAGAPLLATLPAPDGGRQRVLFPPPSARPGPGDHTSPPPHSRTSP